MIARNVDCGDRLQALQHSPHQFGADPAALVVGQDLEQRDEGSLDGVGQRRHEADCPVAFRIDGKYDPIAVLEDPQVRLGIARLLPSIAVFLR